jgi:HAD superfamily hydrolase (TIGR01509 family)
MHVRGVILDVDGTLLDSNDAHASSWVDALAEHGFKRGVHEVRRLIGMGGDQLLGLLGVFEHHDDISARKKQLFAERFLPTLRPMRGARELVAELARRGFARVVATSASKDELAALLRAAHVDDLIEDASSKSDVTHSKPDPDVVQAAIRRIGIEPSALVMLGDTPYDIAAAQPAGVRSIALRCGGWTDTALSGAIAIYENPEDLLEHLDDSPLHGDPRGASEEHVGP